MGRPKNSDVWEVFYAVGYEARSRVQKPLISQEKSRDPLERDVCEQLWFRIIWKCICVRHTGAHVHVRLSVPGEREVRALLLVDQLFPFNTVNQKCSSSEPFVWTHTTCVCVCCQAHLPFAVVGSVEEVKVGNKAVRARQYPWGVVQGKEFACLFVLCLNFI